MSDRIPVLIAGGGPVGLTLAIDLGWRDVPCLLVESTTAEQTNPRCNTTGARSMEHFRRLGIADEIRAAGLPDDYPTDVAYRTRFTGDEMLRIDLPSSSMVKTEGVDDTLWPTAEPQHRVAQIFLEPILLKRAKSFPTNDIRHGTELVSFTQHDDYVEAVLRDLESGSEETVEADYLVGCDGARSIVRKAIGAKFEGIEAVNNTVSTYFRSKRVGEINAERPAWITFIYNHETISFTVAIDGKDLWLHHANFPPQVDHSQFDTGELLARSVGEEVDFELLGEVRWTSRAMVADHFSDRRVLLAGDAAHIWIPVGGFGMNAGIQEATALAWMLSAMHHGWGGDELLDAYEGERRPIGMMVAQAARRIGQNLGALELRHDVEKPGEEGKKAQKEIASMIEAANRRQFNPVGLNFGYHYDGSPLVEPDGTPAPEFEIDQYEPDARPGNRLPHLNVNGGTPVFDKLGPDFTLVRVGEDAPEPANLAAAAKARGIPLEILTLTEPAAAELYRAKLILVRPDQHVAWRGDSEPSDTLALMDRVRGA